VWRLGSGEVIACEALTVTPRFVARSDILTSLGLAAVPRPLGVAVGEHFQADAMGLTTVPGVWVAGNVADLTAVVVGVADAGVRAGAAINADLIAEDIRRAVVAHRERTAVVGSTR